MSLIVNGVTIPTSGNPIKVGNTNIDKVVCNGVTVWERIVFTSKDFSYTGGIQSFTAPLSGLYKLEVWGGQGGGTDSLSVLTASGGNGGYATSYKYLTKDDVLYICVGGEGKKSSLQRFQYSADFYNDFRLNTSFGGGYNCGNNPKYDLHRDGVSYEEHWWVCGGGGGATHIAIRSGTLDTLASYVSDVIVIAGGGGGGFINSEPKENGGDDRIFTKDGGPGGQDGNGPFGKNDSNQWGAGGGYGSGYFVLRSTQSKCYGGTNYALGVDGYPAGSQANVNSGNGKAKITFVKP